MTNEIGFNAILGTGEAGWGTSAAAFLLDHLWQSTLFALLAVLLAGSLSQASARLRYKIYLLASLKFLVPSAALAYLASALPFDPSFGLSRRLAGFFDFEQVLGAGFGALGRLPGAHSPGVGLGAWGGGAALEMALLGAWIVPALFLLAFWSRRLARFRTAAVTEHREGSGPEGPAGDAAGRLEQLRLRLGLRRPVALRLSEEVAEPGVWGVWRPVVILPVSMPEHLSREELDAVLLHELVHVRRWDNLVSHLHMVLRSVLWFHPLVWMLDQRLLEERERACDEEVVRLSGDAGTYLRSLAKVLRFGVSRGLAGVSAANGSDLPHRIHRLRGPLPAGSALRHRLAFALAVGLFTVSSLAAGPWTRCPLEAKAVEAEPEETESLTRAPFILLETSQQLAARTAGSAAVDQRRLPAQPPSGCARKTPEPRV